MSKTAVVVPNWNGASLLPACLDSLESQANRAQVIVVDNGSTDHSLTVLQKYPAVKVIKHPKNLGFTGGVNTGFDWAIDRDFDYVATLNNDAVADRNWLKYLVAVLEDKGSDDIGIVTSKLLSSDGGFIDSTGDQYSVWGLPFPRGRGEKEKNGSSYNEARTIFGASGGASLYRVEMLREVGLFDQDFFAYYEDVDLSFRAQLAGWKVNYQPKALAYHQISATTSRLKGFASYQTMKNLQLLYYKNVPGKYLFKVGWRFTVAHSLFLLRAIVRGQGWSALRGDLRGSWLILKGRGRRREIQRSKKVSDQYIWSIMVHDLPPNAHALRKLRRQWWRLRGKKPS